MNTISELTFSFQCSYRLTGILKELQKPAEADYTKHVHGAYKTALYPLLLVQQLLSSVLHHHIVPVAYFCTLCRPSVRPLRL